MKLLLFTSLFSLLTVLPTCFGKREYQESKSTLYLSGNFTINQIEPYSDLQNVHTFSTKTEAEHFCNADDRCRGVTECTTQDETIVFIPRKKVEIKHEEDQGDEKDKLNCSEIRNEFIRFETGNNCKYAVSSYYMRNCPIDRCILHKTLKEAQNSCSQWLHCGGVAKRGKQFQIKLAYYRKKSHDIKVNKKIVSYVKQSCYNNL